MKKVLSILGKLALVAMGLLLPIFLLEASVRLLNLAPPPIPNPNIWDTHPEMGWHHLPDSGGTFYSSYNEYETDIQINAMGLRDDLTLQSHALPDDVFSILVLADSFGESLQVPLEETFFKKLQVSLTESGTAAQTLNAGVGSWGTDQETTFYRLEGHKYEPDLTLLFFFTRNDTVNNYKPLEVARNGGSVQKSFYHLSDDGSLVYPQPFDPDNAYSAEYPKPTPLPPAPLLKTADWLWLHSDLYRLLVPYLRDIPPVLMALGPSGILGGEGRIRATHPAVPVPFYVYQQPLSAEWQEAWQLTEAILVDLRNQVQADGGQFAVVVIPAKEQVYPEQWEKTVTANESMQALDWNLHLPNENLAQIFEQNDIAYLDLLADFESVAADPSAEALYFTHDGHWTSAGHTLTASLVQEFLIEETLIPAQ